MGKTWGAPKGRHYKHVPRDMTSRVSYVGNTPNQPSERGVHVCDASEQAARRDVQRSASAPALPIAIPSRVTPARSFAEAASPASKAFNLNDSFKDSPAAGVPSASPQTPTVWTELQSSRARSVSSPPPITDKKFAPK